MSILRVPVSQHDHIIGAKDASVVLVEYGDYECPHCAMAHPVTKQLLSQFDGKLALVFRHFPLTEVHPNAGRAAEAAEFAGAHGLFWKMHDAIYANQHRLNLPTLFQLASAVGLSQLALRDAFASGMFMPKIRADFIGGVRSGVNGTPTFFINGQRHDGSYFFPELSAAIARHMMEAVV
jgi:protein-disulfide isomerase